MLGRLLAQARWLLLVAVLGSLAVAAAALVAGAARVGLGVLRPLVGASSAEGAKALLLAAVEALDLFLVGAVAYLAAVGVYTLFISRDLPLPVRLGVESLDDLKNKVVGVLVVALGVLFLGQAASEGGTLRTVYLGVGVAPVVFALAYFLRAKTGRGGDGEA